MLLLTVSVVAKEAPDIVGARVAAECTELSATRAPPVLALSSRSNSGAPGVPSGTQQTALQADAELTPPARRRRDVHATYAVDCWAPNSAFVDPSCNCLGEAAHPKLGSRPTIVVVVGGW